MFLFDIVQLVFSFLKTQVFENFLMRTGSFYRFINWVESLPGMHHVNSLDDIFMVAVNSLVAIIPEKFLVGIREFVVLYRLLFDLRVLVGWFPINTSTGILSLITEPVDMILRLFYRLPKVYYIDVPFLLISTGLDNLVSLLDFIIAVAKETEKIY